MHLSKRLRRVAANVWGAETAADVGCDHGFTSICLVLEDRADRVIAMDIGKEPVRRAAEHVKQYGLEEKIEVRQSDGLKGLGMEEADALVISGMGGRLICRILHESEEKVKKMKQIILSPQSDFYLVRKCIHEFGFRIAQEEMVYDQKKYYVILRMVQGEEIYSSDEEYEYGRCLIEEKDPVFCDYIKDKYRKIQKVIETMEAGSLSGRLSLQDRVKEKAVLGQILERLDEVF